MERIFKTKMFGGFNKKQVIEYIDEMLDNYSKDDKANKKKIKELDNQNRNLLEEKKVLEDKIIKLNQLIEDAEKIIEDKNNYITEQESRLNGLNDMFEQQRTILINIKNENTKLQDDLDAANNVILQKNEELKIQTQKADEFDKFKNKQKEIQIKINEFVAKAQYKGNNIINEARVKSEDILLNAKEQATTIHNNAEKLKMSIDDIRLIAQNILHTIDKNSNEINKSIDIVKKECNISSNKNKSEDDFLFDYNVDFKQIDNEDEILTQKFKFNE